MLVTCRENHIIPYRECLAGKAALVISPRVLIGLRKIQTGVHISYRLSIFYSLVLFLVVLVRAALIHALFLLTAGKGSGRREREVFTTAPDTRSELPLPHS